MDLLEPAAKHEDALTYQLTTFGCKVNTYDSGLLEKQLLENGFLPANHSRHLSSDQQMVHILNSCAVTGEATQEVIRQARRLKRLNANCFIVVTGCSAQVDTEKLDAQTNIDLIVANSHKSQLAGLIREKMTRASDRVHKTNIFKYEDLGSGGGVESGHTRAFLKIQDGCNSFCTFCVIPFARGKSRSLAIEDIRRRVNDLLAEGVREIVLTGVHIGDYEFGLENLIEDLLLRTRVPRLRLTSLEPVELSGRLLDLFADPRLCPHFHMSIQSASTPILTRMKRKYDADQVVKSLHNISRCLPNAFIGMDVIVGFPGEGEDEFVETYERLNDAPWTRIHVFPYSERPGTYATRLEGKVKNSAIARRADRLRELSRERYLTKAREQIGLVKKTLILKNGKGLSRDYWNIHFASPVSVDEGHEVRVKVTGLAATRDRLESPLIGTIVG